MPPITKSPDLLRRFVPTPVVADLNVMGRVIHLETNSLRILEQIERRLSGQSDSAPERVDFQWRIVSESGSDSPLSWPDMTAFSQDGLSFAGIGHRGFLAVDSLEREAVGFLPEELVNDSVGFSRPFLAMLFWLTSRAMGLTPISAACVAQGETGLLIFGQSKCGKTVCSYLAARQGLQFHADQAVFLELDAAVLRAWGDFWPSLFYEDAQRILPELPAIARRFHDHARTYFYLEKPGQTGAPRYVTPAACVFLERQNSGAHRLSALPRDMFYKRLNECSRLWDCESSRSRESAAWNFLCNLPAFHLVYGSDLSVPARIFCDLIEGHKR